MRQPYNTLIIPFRIVENKIEYLIAKRSDLNFWQAFSGGGEEEDKTIFETAKRELKEETNLESDKWIKLDSQCSIPKFMFQDNEQWKDNPYVITEFCFGVDINESPKLSEEHIEYKWCCYEEAYTLFKYDSNRTALWELNDRLKLN